MEPIPIRKGIINNNEGCVLINLGSYDNAIAQLHKALLHLFELHLNCPKDPAFLLQRYNSDHPPLHYYPENEYDEGMGTYAQPFFICADCDDKSYGSTEATIYFNLGIAHARTENYSEALLSLKRSLNLQNIIVSPIENSGDVCTRREIVINGPALYMILHNLGHVYFKSAMFTEAVYSYTQALDFLSRDRAVHHRLDISATLNCIAMAKFYDGENNTGDILIILERALALRFEDSFRAEHDRDAATIINNSGRVRSIRGEFVAAFKVYKEAYKQRVAALGEDHIDAAACLVNMAQAKEYQGDVPEAIDLYKQFLDIARVKRGSNSRDVIKALLSIGHLCYDHRYDLEQAHNFFLQALDSAKITYGQNDVTVASIYNRIGNVLFDQRKFDLAIKAYSSGLALERIMYNDRHYAQIATTILNLARANKHLGRLDQALKFYKEAIEIERHLNNEEAAANILIDIGSIYDEKGDTESATNALQEAVAFFRMNHSKDSSLLPSTLNILGLLQHKRGSFTLALHSFLEAIKIYWAFEEVPILDITAVYHNAATIYKKIGENDMALRFFLQTLNLEKNQSQGTDSNYEHSASLNYEIGMIFKERNDFDKAHSYLEQSSKICMENVSMIDSRFRNKVFMALADLYILIGDTEKAMESYTAGMEAGGVSSSGIADSVEHSNIIGLGHVSTYLYRRLCETNPPAAGAA